MNADQDNVLPRVERSKNRQGHGTLVSHVGINNNQNKNGHMLSSNRRGEEQPFIDVEEGGVPKEVSVRDDSMNDSMTEFIGDSRRQGMQRSSTRKSIIGSIPAKEQVQAVQEKAKSDHSWQQKLIIFPSSGFHKIWKIFTVIAAVFTFFFETYQIAFPPAGLQPLSDPSTILYYALIAVYVADMAVSFNLAYFDDENELVCSHRAIAIHYVKKHFWLDVVGALPFYRIVLGFTGLYLQDTKTTQYLALLRLLRLVQMRRVKRFFDMLQFSTKVSLMNLTLIRNGTVAMIWSHFAACTFYFIAKQYDFDADNTWIGPHDDLSPFQTYVKTLYWSVVTFSTVGYGDYSPVNAAEQIFGMIYMLFNIVLMSYIIGSITLLVVKNDEATGMYRDNLQALYNYSNANGLIDDSLYSRLRTQLKVEFKHRDVGDEMVLNKFPKTMRQKVLFKLYSPALEGTNLMRGIREHFITDFLTSCRIVIFSSGEELLTRGAVSSDLFLLVEGTVELSSPELRTSKVETAQGYGDDKITRRRMENRDFINEIAFFTESRQIDTVKTVTICKTLIIAKSDYKRIAEDHPGSIGRLLNNLLLKVRAVRSAHPMTTSSSKNTPKGTRDRSGSDLFDDSHRSYANDDSFVPSPGPAMQSLTAGQSETALAAVQELVERHINKQKDDNTTRFLFAASRDDVPTVRLMCEQGFDPNSCDYDSRSALMVASMKGNVDTVNKLLEYGADPNLKDMHGTSALMEAINNGQDDVIEIFLNQQGNSDMRWMDSATASTLLNQAVFDGNISKLERYLKCKINLDAGDYDKRTPLHIAASEGNLIAVRALVEAGANLHQRDRWNNLVVDDAARSRNGKLLEYLQEQMALQASPGSPPSNLDEEAQGGTSPV